MDVRPERIEELAGDLADGDDRDAWAAVRELCELAESGVDVGPAREVLEARLGGDPPRAYLAAGALGAHLLTEGDAPGIADLLGREDPVLREGTAYGLGGRIREGEAPEPALAALAECYADPRAGVRQQAYQAMAAAVTGGAPDASEAISVLERIREEETEARPPEGWTFPPRMTVGDARPDGDVPALAATSILAILRVREGDWPGVEDLASGRNECLAVLVGLHDAQDDETLDPETRSRVAEMSLRLQQRLEVG